MAIKTFQYALAQDVRQLIAPPSVQPQEVHIHNHEHSQGRNLYIGDETVTVTTGHHVLAETDIVIYLQPGQYLYGITPDGAGCDVTVLCVEK
jgi:dUTPase